MKGPIIELVPAIAMLCILFISPLATLQSDKSKRTTPIMSCIGALQVHCIPTAQGHCVYNVPALPPVGGIAGTLYPYCLGGTADTMYQLARYNVPGYQVQNGVVRFDLPDCLVN